MGERRAEVWNMGRRSGEEGFYRCRREGGGTPCREKRGVFADRQRRLTAWKHKRRKIH